MDVPTSLQIDRPQYSASSQQMFNPISSERGLFSVLYYSPSRGPPRVSTTLLVSFAFNASLVIDPSTTSICLYLGDRYIPSTVSSIPKGIQMQAQLSPTDVPNLANHPLCLRAFQNGQLVDTCYFGTYEIVPDCESLNGSTRFVETISLLLSPPSATASTTNSRPTMMNSPTKISRKNKARSPITGEGWFEVNPVEKKRRVDVGNSTRLGAPRYLAPSNVGQKRTPQGSPSRMAAAAKTSGKIFTALENEDQDYDGDGDGAGDGDASATYDSIIIQKNPTRRKGIARGRPRKDGKVPVQSIPAARDGSPIQLSFEGDFEDEGIVMNW